MLTLIFRGKFAEIKIPYTEVVPEERESLENYLSHHLDSLKNIQQSGSALFELSEAKSGEIIITCESDDIALLYAKCCIINIETNQRFEKS